MSVDGLFTWENLLALFAVVMGSNWLGQFLTEVYKSKSKKKSPVEIILKALSRNHLLASADRYHEAGYIPKDEYDDIYEEYRAYRALDGNGRVEREFGKDGELTSLPVK